MKKPQVTSLPDQRSEHVTHLREFSTLPRALEAEMALLGAIILDSTVAEEVAATLRGSQDFETHRHGVIFSELIDLATSGAVDMVKLNQRLTDKGLLQDVGGLAYLIELFDGTPSALEAVRYAKIVRDKATLRGLLKATETIIRSCYLSDGPASDVVDQAQALINRIDSEAEEVEFVPIGFALLEVEQALEDRSKGKETQAIPTGFHSLDEVLDDNGITPGDVVVIGARPAIGKSVFALNVAHNMAVRGIPCCLYSLEMSAAANAKRFLALNSNLPTSRMRHPASLSRNQWDDIQQAVARGNDYPLDLVSTAGMTIERFRHLCRRGVNRRGHRVAIIDYLQLMSGSGQRGQNRQEQIAEISRGIKTIAMELDIVVYALSQISREAVQGTNPGMPQMHHLRESGTIEQDASVVMLLHRDDYYTHLQDPHATWTNELHVAIAKQREGCTGIFPLHFDGGRRRISDLP